MTVQKQFLYQPNNSLCSTATDMEVSVFCSMLVHLLAFIE